MINAAIVGLGWWAGTLVESVQEGSDAIRFVSAFSRSRSPKDRETAAKYGLSFADSYEALLADPAVDAVVLATPPAGHRDQILAAARAGKHVFCEKPFTMTRAEAEQAVRALADARRTLGLGYNRRFHPSWVDLKRRIAEGELGTILHMECTMTVPNGLTMAAEAWRAKKDEAPCGGLFPLGVHAVDGMIDLQGPVDSVFCQSFRRAIPGDNDDTTSVLLRLRNGASAYLGTMMATAGSFRFQVYGSKAIATLGGSTHVVGASSYERRARLFGSYMIQPVQGEKQALEAPLFDVNRAELEAFARAAEGGPAYPIALDQMVHGVAVTEAIIASSRSGKVESIG